MDSGTDGRVSAVNFHLTSRCNYRCGFCFSSKPTRIEMGPGFWMKALEDLKERGIRKVNFVGGEPFLYGGLEGLCRRAKELGYYTSIVSNGSLATREVLSRYVGILDCIGLSVDSVSEDTERGCGRGCSGHRHLDGILEAADAAHSLGIDVKLNITVISGSAGEDFSSMIRRVDPCRVKVFRVLKLEGVNAEGFDKYAITDRQFGEFRERHADVVLSNGEVPVYEDNDVMSGGYLMLNPEGMFKFPCEGRETYVRYEDAIDDLDSVTDREVFLARGGNYFLETRKTNPFHGGTGTAY